LIIRGLELASVLTTGFPRPLRSDGKGRRDGVDVDIGAAMAKLIYASNVSLDGYTEDERGAFDWAVPDDDVFAFITDLMRSSATYLYGRRLYDTMAVWETDAALAAQSDLMSDFANVWKAADKVVYSTTLAEVPTGNTRIERHFDPDAVRDLKAAASSDLIVGGPNLAAQALKAGLVEECHLFIWPVVLAGRKPALPDDTRTEFELLEERRFRNGVVHLAYRPLKEATPD
jgi:dihydrofolate reductase